MRKYSVAHEPLGYWQKPRLIKLIAFGYLAFPILFWFQLGGAAGAGAESALFPTAVFFQELFCAITAATAVLWVTRPSLVYLIALTVYFLAVKLNQFGAQAPDSGLEVAWAMFWFAAPAAILMTRAHLPYLEPRRRWWKRPQRYVHQTGAQVLVRGVKFPLLVMNISSGGAFVKLDEKIFHEGAAAAAENDARQFDGTVPFPNVNPAERFIALSSMHEYPRLGDVVSVAIETLPGLDSPFDENRFTAIAEVVWVTKVTDPYRFGLGLKFQNVPLRLGQRLRRYIRLLPAQSTN